MAWRGEFAFGPAAMVFRGDSAETRFHAHAAVQCVYSPLGTQLQDEHGTTYRGAGWMIRSGTVHCLAPASRLVLILVEPQSPLARGLSAVHSTEAIAPLHEQVIAVIEASPEIHGLLPQLEQHLVASVPAVDPRVAKALDQLEVIQARDPAAVAAVQAGVSTSRLRALCRAQFGVPFSKLIVWRKVRRACLAMSRGQTLAQAAADAGFSDQAHLTRTMSDVIGLTPGEAARASD